MGDRMLVSWGRGCGVLGLVGLLTLSSLGLGAVMVPVNHTPSSSPALASHGVPAPAAQPSSAPPGVPVLGPTATLNLGSQLATAALAATKADGLKPNVVFVPRPSATAAQLTEAKQTGAVSPLYTGSPAPMGLAYYGLSAGARGAVVPTILNTTSLIANVNFNATGVQAYDLVQSSPDSFGIQLNAVVTNVTLFGTDNYSFWTQNVVEYLPATHVMILITNVWNFSGGPLSLNVFYQHGPDGTQVGTTYYYAEEFVPFPVYYPFNLTLWENSTVADGRNAVDFNVGLESPEYPSEDFVAPYDYVIFNSLAAGGLPLTVPSNYTANGESYNPIGLTDDFELIFGGPGSGSQSTLFAADATLGLGYWDGTGYTSVPAAYSYGGETGETVTGANIAWSDIPGGIPSAGLATYGTMTTGPSVLTGLWNATAPEGSYTVTLDVSPANAFNLLATAGGWSSNFTISELSIAPELASSVVHLSPGDYTLLTELADYAPVTTALDVTSNTTVTVVLAPSPSLGVYTPLWAFSNAEVASISSGGTGAPATPYQVVNNQYHAIGSAFGLYNDFGFPVYPSVFLYDTDVSVEFNHPPSFTTATSTFQFPGRFLPSANDLQYWFWNVSNASIVNATNISGWFAATVFAPAVFDTFSVIFYEGGHNLIAGDTFDSEGQGLLLFSGGTFFGPLNVGGGNNTIWGNHFYEVPAPLSVVQLLPAAYGLALEIAESNDLIYNNYIDTPTTAWLLPINLYSGAPEFFSDAFNITLAPASARNYAPGFPFEPLTGSIIGTSYQGGNFWWDYGLAVNPYNGADNPYGVLPYEERATTLLVYVYGPSYYYATYIYPGGDYLPLTLAAFYSVTVREKGLPTGLYWGAEILDAQGFLVGDNVTNSTSFTVEVANGAYSVVPVSPGGWTSPSLRLVVAGRPTGLTLAFRIATGLGARELTFYRSGLPAHTTWSVAVEGTSSPTDAYNATETTTSTSLVFAVGPGTYTFAASPVPGYQAPGPKVVTIGTRNVGVTVSYPAFTYPVTVSQTGLPGGLSWSVTIDGRTVRSTGAALVIGVPNGTYTFEIHAPIGWLATPASGTIAIRAGSAALSVSFARR